jgi:hypothetical protein
VKIRAVVIAAVAVIAFLVCAGVLGSLAFLALMLLIGPHGMGLVPEWLNPFVSFIVLALVLYFSWWVASVVRAQLSRRFEGGKESS